jgi:cytochrome c biogenesis protein
MKKVLSRLFSMKAANLLLALVALLCGLSSLIPQGRELPFYAENYPRAYTLIYRTHFYDVFSSWYFVLLMGLLCLSLLVCSVRMFRRALKSSREDVQKAAALPNAEHMEPGQLEQLRRWAASRRCKEEQIGESFVFHKNRIGYWGLFLLHIAVLLAVFFGVFALAMPKVTDLDCRPGESVSLEDGTRIEVESFSMKNESGQLDYASRIQITLPDGQRSPVQEIKVNYPMTFGKVKVFQWTYGVSPAVMTRSKLDGTVQFFDLDRPAFLSEDGFTGVQYLGTFEAEDQENPAAEKTVFYQVRLVSNGVSMPDMSVLPGESVSLGDWEFIFEDPYYPGLRVKEMPFPYANSLLEAAMVLLLLGMFLCFYLRPVVVRADETGYTVAGPRPDKLRLELRKLLLKEESK